MARQIFITEKDKKRLLALISETKEFGKGNKEYLKALEQELELAQEVVTELVPNDVITMNSKVCLRDLESGEDMVFTLVYPHEANIKADKISILAPVGTAILGFSIGDVITWNVPDGLLNLQVIDILYQPEAAGDLDL
ncbi:MAG: nucleoside diphosphate kinase regulator [Clostridia bacterium]